MADNSRTRSQIEADLGATRDRLTASLESLIDQVHPNRIKQREIGKLKQAARNAAENAKSLVFNARGDLRRERVIAVGGGAVGLTTFLIIVRAIARRRSAR